MKVRLLIQNENICEVYKNLPYMKNMNVFQSKFYFDVLKSSKQTRPYLLVAEEDNKITGIALIQIQNYFSSILRNFSSRSIISGGPLFRDDGITLTELLTAYYKYFNKSVVYTQVRNIFNLESYDYIFEKYNFRRIGHLNYLIDLEEDIDVIWGNVYSKRKNEIRKGVKDGIKVKEISYDSELNKAYKILELIYKKAKLPFPSYNYFDNTRKVDNGDEIIRIFGGYLDDELIGVMFLLCFNGRVYNWYAGSNPVYYKKYPNDVITWEAIKWASESGYKIFDFGGAGNPDIKYGVREYKKKFGGAEINYGRYESIHKPFVMKVSNYGFKLWQKFK